MTTPETGALFARRDQAWADRDVVTLAASYAENCVLESPTAGTIIGRVAIENVYRIWFSAFPDIKLDTEELLIMGDRVVQTVTVHGTNTGGFLGLPPTGKPFRVRGVFNFELQNNQIVHERRILDFSGVLLQLAGQAGAVIQGSQLYRETIERARLEHDIEIAAEIQRALLPERRYSCAHFEVVAASVPCRAIGGDFFDYFDLPSGAFGFALGDVSGKGPPAALLAAVLQGILSAHAYAVGTPAQTMTLVNETLYRRAVDSRFATMLYGVLALDGQLTYCNAGHSPPILINRRGVQRLEKGGPIVGVFKQPTFEEEVVKLDPDGTLVIFSDGLTEAMNCDDHEFGEERLLSSLRANWELPASNLLECLLGDVRQFTATAGQSDDLTVFVLRYLGA
jgi:steroid delta-isomerase-like uncharacterized protein